VKAREDLELVRMADIYAGQLDGWVSYSDSGRGASRPTDGWEGGGGGGALAYRRWIEPINTVGRARPSPRSAYTRYIDQSTARPV